MSELTAYRRFMGTAEFEKAVNSLIGLIEGITIDSKINEREVGFLNAWLGEHRIRANKHPFNELIPVVEQAISDGVLTEEEKADISWLCNKLTSAAYFNEITADLQKLHAVLAGVASDGQITVEELKGVSSWLQEHEHLKRCWPYDEVDTLITSVMVDQKIDPDEHKMLMGFFGEFISLFDNKTVVNPLLRENSTIVGLCAVCPEITFADAVFCITGISHKYTRPEFEKIVCDLGGTASGTVTRRVNYLVVGADGNPCWAYACYGRKVEKAVALRKKGSAILIVHENDVHDAIADQLSA